jgi:thymidylate synthase
VVNKDKRMKQYLDLLQDILDNGELKDDRTGVGTYSVFGRHIRFDLRRGFPAVTTKKLAWKACVGELLWFIEGSSDERRLAELTHGTSEGKVTIWTPNALAPYWKPKAMEYNGAIGTNIVQKKIWAKRIKVAHASQLTRLKSTNWQISLKD